jgi:hypothetical protein
MSPASNRKIQFPGWLPQSARDNINARWATSLGKEDEDAVCGLLKRLATFPIMRTEVWERLPQKGLEGLIVGWAIDAYWVFHHLPRPLPKTRAKLLDYAKHLEKFRPFANHDLTSYLFQCLHSQVYITKPEADFYWKRFWSGDATMGPDKVVEILDQLRAFYAKLHTDQQTFIDALPRVNRWNAKAQQKFFTEYLSDRFRVTFNQPLDAIVAALTSVAFDLREGIAAETVRGRRRFGKTPEKSIKKPR